MLAIRGHNPAHAQINLKVDTLTHKHIELVMAGIIFPQPTKCAQKDISSRATLVERAVTVTLRYIYDVCVCVVCVCACMHVCVCVHAYVRVQLVLRFQFSHLIGMYFTFKRNCV